MKNVTDRVHNPFGMQAPGGEPAVYGYGDANADFHVIGDHPGVHGGIETGIPFTDSETGRRIQRVLHAVGLLQEPYSDEPGVRDVFFSYLHLTVPNGDPTLDDYQDLERFFDAELRAITAHVLLPVGDRAIRHVLEQYTTVSPTEVEPATLHATEIRGGGWLVLPIADPMTWDEEAEQELINALEGILSTDYRRETDLGRFSPGGEPYFVR